MKFAALPVPQWGQSSVALWSCALYVGLALGLRGGVPFVRFPAFGFPTASGETAVLLFRAGGVDARVRDFSDFTGIQGADVDVRHRGIACSSEHALYEAAEWIAGHQAGGDPGGDTVPVQVGLRILGLGPDGDVVERLRIDREGTARRAPR